MFIRKEFVGIHAQKLFYPVMINIDRKIEKIYYVTSIKGTVRKCSKLH